MDPESEPLSNPPPAYSEQEFDQKVSLATELSVFDDDGWQQYDPYAFEDDCAPNLTSKCTGRLGLQGPPFPTAPLRFEKKQQSNGLEAHSVNNQNASTSYSSWPEAGPLPSKSILPHPEDLYTSKHIHVPYSSSARTVPQQGGQVENQPMPLSYHSKTQSTVTLPLPQPVIPQNHPTPNVSKSNYYDSPTSRRLRSLPATPAPKHAFKVEERPISTYHPIQAPLVHFDASMAYGNATPPSSLIEQPIASKSNIQSDSYLFYNSAVSAQLNRPPAVLHHNTKQFPMQTRSTIDPSSQPAPQVYNNNGSPRPDSVYIISNPPQYGPVTSINRSSNHYVE